MLQLDEMPYCCAVYSPQPQERSAEAKEAAPKDAVKDFYGDEVRMTSPRQHGRPGGRTVQMQELDSPEREELLSRSSASS